MAIQLREPVSESAPEVAPRTVDQRRARGEVVVRVRGYGRTFGDRTVLSNIDIELHEGELTAVLGASGSGKSTLLRALAGQDPAADGHVSVPRVLAVSFQDHRLLPWKRV